MGLMAINETVGQLGEKQSFLTNKEREFVVQFAFKSGDIQLAKKLIDELIDPDTNNEMVIQRFTTMMDIKPHWIEQIENLLVAIELYRIEEEKAVESLVDVLKAYGIDVSIDEIKNLDTSVIKDKVQSERVK